MDLNYLLHRHQLSLMNATAAPRTGARSSHHGLARGYGQRIRVLRAAMGALVPERCRVT